MSAAVETQTVLEAAETKHTEALAKLEEVRERLNAADAEAARLQERLTEAERERELLLEEGKPLEEVRAKWREAGRALFDLRPEQDALRRVVSKREEDVTSALVDLEHVRRQGILSEAENVAKRIRRTLAKASDLIAELEGLETRDQRSRDLVRNLPNDRPNGPRPVSATFRGTRAWAEAKRAISALLA